ncbi:MAG TPA: flagellar basal body L-ring protein FlgH [Alphaproteobacteria bacterium]|jgi:flagellar L-ring protein precursor FlgH
MAAPLRHLLATVAIAALALGACTPLDRLAEIGEPPVLTNPQNPTARPSYRPVTMPMPAPEPVHREANSLWRAGARGFFKDQRASKVGDIITVNINIADSAAIKNQTQRTRASDETAEATALLGYESSLNRMFPQEIDPTNLINAGATSLARGSGSIDRTEAIKLKVAAVVTQVLPNGNLVIHARQEVRVNSEMRELQIAGVIRREDISSANTIAADKIAEARVAYGGRGTITDVQQPRYGQQIYDIIFPF